MDQLRFTLLSDGSSDRALLPVLSWVLQAAGDVTLSHGEWADLSVLRRGTTRLTERIQWAVELFPCDLLFVHRDAERQHASVRYEEVEAALRGASAAASQVAHVCVVPVRMQEAWLLFDERAIRTAAGNPGGVHPFGLPRLDELESLSDPKATLHGALERASGLVGRSLKKFEPRRRCFDVAEAAADGGFEPLRALPSFARLLDDVAALRDTGALRRPRG